MRKSQLNESLIYAVKHAIDEITKIDFEDRSIVSFDLSQLHDQSEIPDAIQLEEQIRVNLENCSSKTKYVNGLIKLFPYLEESIDFLTEEKYRVKSSMAFLMSELGYLVDFNERGGEDWIEKGLRYFYFGENYKRLNRNWNEVEKSKKEREEIARGYVRTPFQEKAYSYFHFYDDATPEDKDEDSLIDKLNLKYGILDESYSRANALLNAADVINTAICELRQQSSAAGAELSPIELEYGSHKIVLMHELGIIKFLRGKYPKLTATDLSKILSPLIGVGENHIRLAISGYGNGVKNDPKTDAAYKEVKGELIKFGIEI